MVKIDNYTLAIGAVILVLGGAVIYYLYTRSTGTSNFQEETPPPRAPAPSPVTPHNTDRKGPTMVLFYGDHCPHCHNMMPAWEEAKKQLSGKVYFKELESKNPETASHPPPKGVPTIRLFPQGTNDVNAFIEYNGDRSAGSLAQFASTGK